MRPTPSAPAALALVLIALLAGVAPGAAGQQGEQTADEVDAARDGRPAAAEPARSRARSAAATATAGTVVPPVRPRSVTVADRGVIEVGGTARPQGRWKGFPVSLSLRKAPLPEVLRSFARIGGFNLVLDPRVQGEVTVELEDVPWDQALHVILKTHGMGAEVDGRVWVVGPR